MSKRIEIKKKRRLRLGDRKETEGDKLERMESQEEKEIQT